MVEAGDELGLGFALLEAEVQLEADGILFPAGEAEAVLVPIRGFHFKFFHRVTENTVRKIKYISFSNHTSKLSPQIKPELLIISQLPRDRHHLLKLKLKILPMPSF
jgi:hypothetical protein